MKPIHPEDIYLFADAKSWREWLEINHTRPDGIWLRLAKMGSSKMSVTHAQALDEALCFGWIDALAKKYDAETWLLRFTPRRPKSIWSKVNREHVARLIQEKKMTEHGLKEIERAKKDGRWDAAYDSPKTMVIPEDFISELKDDPDAYAFYTTLNRTNTYAIAWRLQTAKKPETREKRKKILLEMLHKHEKLH